MDGEGRRLKVYCNSLAMNPTLSIITVNFNNRDGLQKTIDSVVAQSFRDFEWIVIDGGSTDGSRELLEQYAGHFSYWVSEQDKGVYNAMNKGVSIAHGDYLNFMNSGDIFADNNVLSKVFAEKHSEDILYGDWILQFADKEIHVSDPNKLDLVNLFNECICHQSMFIKTELLREKGYDETYSIMSDWKRWLEAIISGKTGCYLPFLICVFDCSGRSFQYNEKYWREEKRLFDEDLKQFHALKRYARNEDIIELHMFYDKSLHYARLLKKTLKLIKRLEKYRLFCKKILHR